MEWEELIKQSKNLNYEPVSLYKYYAQYTPSLLYTQFMCCLGRWHWYDQITEHIYLGAMPIQSHITSRDDLQTLKELKIDAILSVVECYENHTTGYTYSPIIAESSDIMFVQIPIPDFEMIEVEKVDLCIDFIDYIVKQNKKIYISCRVGKSRSSFILMCYFKKILGYTSEDAYNFIKSKRIQIQNKHFKTLQQY